MPNSKLYNLLKTLKPRQINELITFSKLPSLNVLKQDAEIIDKYLEAFQKKKFVESDFWNSYTSDSNEKEIIKIKSRLKELLRKYIIFTLQDYKSPLSNLSFISYLDNHNLDGHLKIEHKNLSKSILSSKEYMDERNSLYQTWKYEIEVILGKREWLENSKLNLMETALDQFYLENKLRCSIEQLNRTKIINSQLQHSNLEKKETDYIFNISPSTNGSNIYHHIYLMYSKNSEKYFLDSLELINELKSNYNSKYLNDIYSLLMNFCSRLVNNGKHQYAKTYIKFISDLIEKKILLIKNKISISRYLSAITMSLIINDTDWAKDFANTYGSKIDHEEKDIIKDMKLAQIALHENKISDAKAIFPEYFPSKSLYLEIERRKLDFKIELQDKIYENWPERINTFRKYIQNQDRLSNKRKEKVLKLLSFLNSIQKDKAIALDQAKFSLHPSDYIWLESLLSQ